MGVRVRPPLPREIGENGAFHACLAPLGRSIFVTTSDRPVIVTHDGHVRGGDARNFKFDSVFPASVGTRQVYDELFKPAVDAVLSGMNATLLAYGQTGTGKTYTMSGGESGQGAGGVTQIAATSLLSARPAGSIRISYLQIYRGIVTDLLASDAKSAARHSLKLREEDGVVRVMGLTTHEVTSLSALNTLMKRAAALRNTAATLLNSTSSRSHAVLSFYVSASGRLTHKMAQTAPKLHVVDLAGSERVKDSGVSGEQLVDAAKINLSLFHLARVVQALVRRGNTPSPGRRGTKSIRGKVKRSPTTVIPYKDSALTRLLSDAIGGTSVTALLATVAPSQRHARESVSTLNFATACSKIKNSAPIAAARVRIEAPKKKEAPPPRPTLPWRKEAAPSVEPRRVWVDTKYGGLSAILYDPAPEKLNRPEILNGSGSRGLAVVLHGYPSEAANQQWVAPALVWAGFRVALLDMPGCGKCIGERAANGGRTLRTRSEKNLVKGGAADLVQGAICSLQAKYSEKKAVVVGYDWGAGIGFSMARSAKHRKSVAALVAFHPSYNEETKGELASGVTCPLLLVWCKEDQFHSWSRWRPIARALQSALGPKRYDQHIFSERAWAKTGWTPSQSEIERRVVQFLTGSDPAPRPKLVHARAKVDTITTDGRKVTRKDNVVVEGSGIAAEKALAAPPPESPEAKALRIFKAAFEKGTLPKLFSAAVGPAGEERKRARSIFARLPCLAPDALRNPSQLLDLGLWSRGPMRWDLLARAPRYTRGRRVLVRARVGAIPANASCFMKHSARAERTTVSPLGVFSRARLRSGDVWIQVELPVPAPPCERDDGNMVDKSVLVDVDPSEIEALNEPHILPYDAKTRELTLEDGIRCRYESPLARAKMCQIALSLAPLVSQIDFGARGEKQVERSFEVQKQCVRAVRSCLDMSTFQRDSNGKLNRDNMHSRDTTRYCGDDAAQFAAHGQGHCHTVTSVMTAFLYPWERLIGVGLKYRGGSVFGLDSTESVVDQGAESHQWLELTMRPSNRTVTCDLYRSDGTDDAATQAKLLAQPMLSTYLCGLHPHGRLMTLSGKKVRVGRLDWSKESTCALVE